MTWGILQALLSQATRDRLGSGDGPHRLVADLLAAMTERQVIQTYQRFTGIISTSTAYFLLRLLRIPGVLTVACVATRSRLAVLAASCCIG